MMYLQDTRKESEVRVMIIDEKHCKMADAIIEILEKGECTVVDAAETLRYVSDVIRNSTTVQVKEKLAESFKENFS